MTKFRKGQSGNPSGRKKGAKNRTTEQLRGMVQSFIEDNWNRIQADFDDMKPPERLSFINSLLKFVLPNPPSFETLSEAQLESLHQYLKVKYNETQS